MRTLAEPRLPLRPTDSIVTLPISVIIPVRNEARNLPRCLESLRGVGEVYVVDSNSSDETAEIARSFDATVVQFTYRGGWPKKRQWAMETLPNSYDLILLVDADEALTPLLAEEMRRAIQDYNFDGYYIALQMFFLGRALRHSDASFCKLSLFRRGKGRFECRLKDQDTSMCDMEVHEHVVVDGSIGMMSNQLPHQHYYSLSRYIQKHDNYSNWEASVWLDGNPTELPPSLFATQAQRRRWLRTKPFAVPGSPV